LGSRTRRDPSSLSAAAHRLHARSARETSLLREKVEILEKSLYAKPDPSGCPGASFIDRRKRSGLCRSRSMALDHGICTIEKRRHYFRCGRTAGEMPPPTRLRLFMQIRDYIESDSKEIADLFHESVHSISTDFYLEEQLEAWAPTPPDYEFWKRRLDRKRPYVAIIDNRIVGFIELEPDGHIDCMYVKSNYQRQGIAMRLFSYASKIAVDLGVEQMYVEASNVAKSFFEKHGFKVIGQNVIQMNGQTLINYSMSGQPKP
jgi:putative acetyltransferase